MMGPLADQDARLNNLGFKLAQENKCVIILNLNSLKVSSVLEEQPLHNKMFKLMSENKLLVD